MSQPYVGEIRMFAGNFAPAGWAFCDGQLLPISENETLFNLIGTTYGGDGQQTFALPELRGRIPIHQGGGRIIGQMEGSEQVTLTQQQMPAHAHAMHGSADQASPFALPPGSVMASNALTPLYDANPVSDLSASAIGSAGASQPHDNMAPYLCVNFIISLFGIFPSQS
jgi:microcystin-dependent protein